MNKDAYGPGFLKAEDLLRDGVWREYSLTVKTVHEPNTLESAEGVKIPKRVLEFQETKKRLALNMVNERCMKYATGQSEPKDWVGKKITVHARIGDWFRQKGVAALRIRVQGKAMPFMVAKHFGEDLTGVKQV